MNKLLEKSYSRNTFFILTISIIILVLILRFYTIPFFSDAPMSWMLSLTTLLDNLVASLFVTIFIAIFIFWITPEIVKKSMMDIVHPKEISKLLKDASTVSKDYYFKGVAGRYTRAVTIPTMSKNAQAREEKRNITLCLINPNNNKLCSQYATYRNSVASAKGQNPWNENKVRNEVVSTIISALLAQHEESLLNIKIYLQEHFSAFRVDISNKYVIITKEDKQASALKADNNTYFYDSYIDEIELQMKQSIHVKNGTFRFFFTRSNINEDNLIIFLKYLKILDDTSIQKLDLNKIISSIQEPTNPYA